MSKRFFTSESVTEGHPDKICDQISDAILDALIAKDKNARVACETMCFTGSVLVAGEISTNCYVDIPTIVRETVKKIGYTRAKYGFDGNTCAVLTSIDEQSGDIALGVDNSMEYKQGGDALDKFGAGDQGMMFGFACDETKELMPLAHMLANKICMKLAEVRKNGRFEYLRPDGKAQVTVEYDGDKVKRVDTVVLSTQHAPDVEQETLRRDMIEEVIKAVIPSGLLDRDTKYYVNPTGKFVIGGPMGDTGLTGRKIIVDTYGGYCAHGGGCFSGKDPTKVDRSAAYMCRYICKNIVAAGLARKVEMQVSYAIGIAKPVSIFINSFGTGAVTDEKLSEIVAENFDLRPRAIIDKLDLLRPVYSATAAYGHFGREEFPWEKTDMVKTLKKYLKN
ncbi:MAG: methionine adenosyltransferase [Clostridiales bacterium]|nr:methionine adenosyltransferase [Clostridiales bacterium]MDY5678071.1 methionine adenosyltransferase [Eubacteriales bacterium]